MGGKKEMSEEEQNDCFIVYFEGHLILPKWYLKEFTEKNALKQGKERLNFMVKNDQFFTYYNITGAE